MSKLFLELNCMHSHVFQLKINMLVIFTYYISHDLFGVIQFQFFLKMEYMFLK